MCDLPCVHILNHNARRPRALWYYNALGLTNEGVRYICFILDVTVINEHLAISCGKSVIRIILEKGFLMNMRRTDISLLDPRCHPTDNGTHFLFTTNLTSCGMRLMSSESAFIYMNVIKEVPSEGIITRMAEVDIPFR